MDESVAELHPPSSASLFTILQPLFPVNNEASVDSNVQGQTQADYWDNTHFGPWGSQ